MPAEGFEKSSRSKRKNRRVRHGGVDAIHCVMLSSGRIEWTRQSFHGQRQFSDDSEVILQCVDAKLRRSETPFLHTRTQSITP